MKMCARGDSPTPSGASDLFCSRNVCTSSATLAADARADRSACSASVLRFRSVASSDCASRNAVRTCPRSLCAGGHSMSRCAGVGHAATRPTHLRVAKLAPQVLPLLVRLCLHPLVSSCHDQRPAGISISADTLHELRDAARAQLLLRLCPMSEKCLNRCRRCHRLVSDAL